MGPMKKLVAVALILAARPVSAGEVWLRWEPVQHPLLKGYVVAYGVPGRGAQTDDPATWTKIKTTATEAKLPKVPCLPFPVELTVAAEGNGIAQGPWSKRIVGYPTVEKVIGTGRKDCRCRGLAVLTCNNGVPR